MMTVGMGRPWPMLWQDQIRLHMRLNGVKLLQSQNPVLFTLCLDEGGYPQPWLLQEANLFIFLLLIRTEVLLSTVGIDDQQNRTVGKLMKLSCQRIVSPLVIDFTQISLGCALAFRP